MTIDAARPAEPVWKRLRMSAAVLAACAALGARSSDAAQPAGLVPQPGKAWSNAAIDAARTNAARLTIQQSQPKAILHWNRFNVAPGQAVVFEQQAATWAALNRIHDADPSRIQGSISARGQVYLINQNGIVFANGAQVDVGGLVASTLDITDDLFEQGLLSNLLPAQNPAFGPFANGAPSGTVVVENGAEIRTAREGRVILLGSDVSNNGIISTPDGQAILAAGSKAYLAASNDPALRGLLIEVDNGGRVENLPLSKIVAERGNVTLAGLAVNQSGRVSATTSVNQNGSIRLLARDTVVDKDLGGGVHVPLGSRGGELRFGKASVTEVRPELSDPQTIKDDQAFNRSSIEGIGRTVRLEADAVVAAPAGNVTLTAQAGLEFQPPGAAANAQARIYLEQGSRIDVAGTADVVLPMERNVVEVELRGNELRDAPLQRDGPLRGKTVQVDVRKGTGLADASGSVAQIGRTVEERTTTGGDVSLQSEGDIVVRQGASIDASGGSVRYLDGFVRTSKLLATSGRVVDIGDARPDEIYRGVVDTVTIDHVKWGVSETFSARYGFERGYVEGMSAGTIALLGHAVVLDGELVARTRAGERQRAAGTLPVGGGLILGDASAAAASVRSFKLPDVHFVEAATALPSGFRFATGEAPGSPLDPLPEPNRAAVQVPVAMLRNGGFGRVTVLSNGRIQLGEGVRLDLAPGSQRAPDGSVRQSALALTGREIEVLGSINIPSGAVSLTTVQPLGSFLPAAAYAIRLGEEGTICAAGGWINDLPTAGGSAGSGPALIAGGSVSLVSAADVVLAAGSVIDVSGGAWLDASGALQAGAGGSIRLKSGRVNLGDFDPQQSTLVLGGELRGHGLQRGGALTLDTSRVHIGPDAPEGTLSLAAAFFQRGGFSAYAVNGQDGLTVAAETTIGPHAENRVLDPAYVTAPSATDIARFSSLALLPEALRTPTALTLTAAGTVFGDLLIDRSAELRVEAASQITLSAGNQLTMLGSLAAPAGRITLSTADPVDPTRGGPRDYGAAQSIWLGAKSRIDARGVARVVTGLDGLRRGEVLDGGNVTIDARTGYVVQQPGSHVDVSAVAAELDIVPRAYATPVATIVAGSAGAIDIRAQEGVLLGGSLRAARAAPWSEGGTLSVTLHPAVAGNPSYPTLPRRVIVSNAAIAAFPALAPGEVIDPNARTRPGEAQLNHRALLDAATLNGGGFDSITLRSPDSIELEGDVTLAARRSISLAALSVAAAGESRAAFDAAYVSLSNTTGFAAPAPVAGEGSLVVSAGLIDFEGNVTLSGFERAQFVADGDIRFKGSYFPGGASVLSGQLRTAGALAFDAAQLYPTTMSRFVVEAVGEGARIDVTGRDAGASALSAGGDLTLRAPAIRQGGVIRAPAGSVTLDAAQTLTLAPGSLTSVAASGLVMPFGRTELSGRAYVYALDESTNVLIEAVPQKRVELRGAEVRIESGALVDLSGGGDLRAYEFVPGPGGSRDLLDAANAPGTFAILPAAAAAFAPYDHQIQAAGAASALAVGDAVALAGADGVAAGVYILLPTRYALLPGAYLVSAVNGTRDFPAGKATRRSDGAQIVAGYRTWTARDGSQVRDGRSTGFLVQPGATARSRSEYLETALGSAFAADSGRQTLADAGAAAIRATEVLDLQGSFRANHAPGSAGATLDIAAPKLAVATADAAGIRDDFVRLDPLALSRLDVASMVLGATRSADDDRTRLSVVSSDIVVANDAGNALRAPEIILAANRNVTIRDGSLIIGEGVYASPARTLVVGGDGVSGDGALVRVASGPEVGIVRENAARTEGTLKVETGARLQAQGAVALDATRDHVMRGALELAAGAALALGAGRISLGDTGAVVSGLALSREQVDALGALSSLTLRSYSTLDTYGALSLGSPALGHLSVDSGGLNNYRGADGSAQVRLSAAQVTFTNTRGSPHAGAPALGDGALPVFGNGNLDVHADRIVLGEGNGAPGSPAAVQLEGFAQVRLDARDAVIAEGAGSLHVHGDLSVQTGRLEAATAARYALGASGQLDVLPGRAGIAATEADSLGGSLALTGRSASIGSAISAPAGRIAIAAVGPTADDGVTLHAGARVAAPGASVVFDGVPAHAAAGVIDIRSAAGSLVLESGSVVDVSSASGADAGEIRLSAPQGSASLQGMLKGGAMTQAGLLAPAQGSFVLDAGTLADFSALNSALDARLDAAGAFVSGGFGAKRDVRVRSGSIVVAAGDRVVAHEVALAADDGDITVDGTIDASGAKGGRIMLAANEAGAGTGSIRIAGRLEASAEGAGTQGRGGEVALSIASSANGAATAATIAIEHGAVVDVSGAGGRISLRAPRLGSGAGTGVAVERLDGELRGAGEIVLEAYKVYNATTVSGDGATTDGGVFNVATTGPFANTVGFREAGDFIAGAKDTILAALGRAGDPSFHLRPGIEIRSPGSLTVAVNETAPQQHLRGWNLSAWRFDGEPGVLTLRAQGDLILDSSLGDGFTATANQAMANWTALRTDDSWSYRLVAGAAAAAANPLATIAGSGDIVLAAGKLVRTGSGWIELAAGRDLTLSDPSSVIYTAGKPGAAIPGYTPPTFRDESNRALRAINPEGGGDIRITVGRDISAIAGSQLISDWLMQRAARRTTSGAILVPNAQTTWWPRYTSFQQGVGTLGGGDVSVVAGRHIENLSVVAPTNGVMGGSTSAAPDPANLVVRGGGDVLVRAGENLKGGAYLVMKGAGRIDAGGDIGSGVRNTAEGAYAVGPILAAGDARFDVRAGGDLTLGTVLDPTLLPQAHNIGASLVAGSQNAFSSYTATTGVALTAVSGDLRLLNDTATLDQSAPQIYGPGVIGDGFSATLYPGTLRAAALRGDVEVSRPFTLFPAAAGNLDLLAGGDVVVGGHIRMSDLDPRVLPSVAAPSLGFFGTIFDGQGRYDAGPTVHSNPPLHAADTNPVRVVAATGDLLFRSGAQLIVAEAARLVAGRDIRDPDFGGQNLRGTDATVLMAGRDIVSTSPIGTSGVPGINDRTIQIGGPGRIEVIAGRDIDLGTSSGIVTRGPLDNPFLPESGASILVLAGAPSAPDYAAFVARYIDPPDPAARRFGTELAAYIGTLTGSAPPTEAEALTVFRALPASQQAAFVRRVFYAELKETGRDVTASGARGVEAYRRGYEAIETLFPVRGGDAEARGDINLFFSQVKTEQGGEIELMAPRGLINAGLANQGRFSKPASQLGIVTVDSGSILAFTRDDFLVNQSRVFTVAGGNILIWSSEGNIDAGRGAKTTSATPPPQFRIDADGVISLDITQSIAGSGIGVLLGRPGVTPGDVDLIAPKGEVNAGDAGIRSAGNLNIAAVRVVGADNIQVGGRSTGVPTADTSALGASLAASSATGSDATRSGEQATRGLAEAAQAAQALKESFRPSFLTVEVLGVGEDEPAERKKP